MQLIWTILIGFVAGVVAKFLAPGTGPSGFFLTAALGIAGSLIASFLGQYVGWYKDGETAGFIGATLGAIVLLAIYHFFRKNKS
jgi:uncharacterized membrane protein YeaQ/YmgE (transglycosylase-associated protein family)